MQDKITTLFYATDVSVLNDRTKYDTAMRSLKEDEKNKVNQFKEQADRLRSLGSKILLKRALKDFGVDFNRAVIKTNEYGKPYLANEGDVFFNISHSGNIALCAVSQFEVGCDVEKITDLKNDIARRYFSPSEYERIKHTDSEENRKQLFFRFWTLKESFIKAIGLGLSISLSDFSFDLDKSEPTVNQKTDKRTFFFKEFSDITGYQIALALNGNTKDIKLKTIDLSESMEP